MKPRTDALLMALDCGSPTVSVAVGTASEIRAERHLTIQHSSEPLLAQIDQTLAEAQVGLDRIEGLVGLRGPGSFTGLRVGLAALLGLQQATGLPATALPTLEVLAQTRHGESERTVAVVNALKGEWFVQSFDLSGAVPRALSEPSRVPADELGDHGSEVVGFGVSELEHSTLTLHEAPPLAAHAIGLALADSTDWDLATLLDPLYLREPVVRMPGAPRKPS